ncbi:ABC transporter, ATP-binding protein [Streptococcus pseudoporcinus]|uniref:ABC transporter, ATP-binding protein n=1 Tax=Streptococcus pseudoporcinus TaxID=361101 RepID=A0A4U9ZNQ3_9STRE|nr:ABC transporter ATP-binding protein [Streptococcus pseudoporcinus]VTS41304.1 ABC transporter, ATP-binding protein [Streptococcus pseudoporcinus]
MLHVNNVTKVIGGKNILENISFSVQEGDCVALIGPNGAGKSTLLGALLGDKTINHGSIKFHSMAPKDKRLKQKIAILQQENTIPNNLKVKELIIFFRQIAENPLSEKVIDDLLGFSQSQKNFLAGKLSGGQRRLLSFVLILIGQANILFLDEPTAGMDTSMRKHFWEIIDVLKHQGKTILYTSHYIEEVEHTADRILILHEGRLLRDTSPYALGNKELEKEISLPKKYENLVITLPFINHYISKRDSIQFRTQSIADLWPLLEEAGVSIQEIQIQNKSLLDSLFDQTKGEAK